MEEDYYITDKNEEQKNEMDEGQELERENIIISIDKKISCIIGRIALSYKQKQTENSTELIDEYTIYWQGFDGIHKIIALNEEWAAYAKYYEIKNSALEQEKSTDWYQQLDDVEQKNHELRYDNATMKKFIEDLKTENTKKQERMNNLQEEIQTLREENETIKDENEIIKKNFT